MKNLYESARTVTLADQRAFLAFALDHRPDLRDEATRALTAPVEPPANYPGPGSTGQSNFDHSERLAFRARALWLASRDATGEEKRRLRDRAMESWHVALGWAQYWQGNPEVAREAAHRHVEGVGLMLDILIEFGKWDEWRADREVLVDVLYEHAMRIAPDYYTDRWLPARPVLRMLAGLPGIVRHIPEEPYLAEEALLLLDRFYGEDNTWTWPPDDAGEVHGWGVDSAGCPFYADMFGSGRVETDWKDTHTAWYEPFISLVMNARTIALLYGCEWVDDWRKKLLKRRFHELQRWLWGAAYLIDEDPLNRGLGPSRALPMFDVLDLDKKRFGCGLPPSGQLIFPVDLLIDPNDTDSICHVVEGMTDQHLHEAGGPKALIEPQWSAERLYLIARWRER